MTSKSSLLTKTMSWRGEMLAGNMRDSRGLAGSGGRVAIIARQARGLEALAERLARISPFISPNHQNFPEIKKLRN